VHLRPTFAVLVGLVFAHAPVIRAEPLQPADPAPVASAPATPQTAQRGRVTLSVQGEPVCVGAEDLLARVAAEVPTDDIVPVAIEVSGREREVAFVITTSSGSASRRFAFDDAGCDARLRVLALALALALESLVVEDAPLPDPTPPPTIVAPPPTTKPPTRDEPPAKASTETPSRTPMWSLAIAPIAVFGALPIPGAGGELQPRVSGRRWSVRLGLGVFTSPRVPLGVGTFRASSFTVTPDGCGLLPAGAAAVRLCAGVELGMVWARGEDYEQSRSSTAPHVAPRVAVEFAAPVAKRVSLLLGAGLAVPIFPVQFVAGDLTASGWPVIVRAIAGVAVDLGPKPAADRRRAPR
jgi:hypothetical protein